MSELDKETLAKGLQILTDQQTIVNNTQREHARLLETHQAVFEEVVRQVSTNGGRTTDLSGRLTNLEQSVNQQIVPRIVEAVNQLAERITALENTNTRLQAEALAPVVPQMPPEGETTVNSTINTTFDPGRVTLNDLLAMSPQLAIGLIRRQGVRNPQIEEAIQVRAGAHLLANQNGDRFEPVIAVSESMAREMARIRAGGQLVPQAAPVTVTETQPSLAQMYIAQQGLNGIGLSRAAYELEAYGNTVTPIAGARSGRLSNQQVNDLLGVMERAGVIDAARNVATVPNTPLAQPDDRKIEPNL